MFNSNPIANDKSPKPPNIRYYNNDIKGNCDEIENKETLSSTLYTNLGKSCTLNDNSLFNNKNDVYEKTIDGTLNDDNALKEQVENKCSTNDGKDKIINQLKYLSCQLASARNRTYNSSDFDITSAGVSVKEIFKKFKNIKFYLIIIFFLTIYFLTQGFFSSFDVCGNIINLVNNNYSQGWLYWIGLFMGLLIPVIILASLFVANVCGSISSLDKINITDNPAGVDDKIPLGFKRLDNGILLLFLLFLYGFIAVIFTIKRESVGNTFYMIIIGAILFIISIFIYLFYTFTPFFSSGNIDQVNKFEVPLKLFIDQRDEISEITTNQVQIQKIQSVFLTVGIIITVFFVIFMLLGKMKGALPSWIEGLLNGFFGSSAVLIVPIFWIFNLVIALKYFYIYPIILLAFRFIRYFCMGILYVVSDKMDTLKDTMSPNLVEQLDNFKQYTPSWNLIGIDLLKSLLNIMGYENIFSESYTNNNSNNNRNLSANKYLISPITSYLFLNSTDNLGNNTKSRLIVQVIICIITIIIGSSALWGIYKI